MKQEIEKKIADLEGKLERLEQRKTAIVDELNDHRAALRVIGTLENTQDSDNTAWAPDPGTAAHRILSALDKLGGSAAKSEIKEEVDNTGPAIKQTTFTGTLQRLKEGAKIRSADGKWHIISETHTVGDAHSDPWDNSFDSDQDPVDKPQLPSDPWRNKEPIF